MNAAIIAMQQPKFGYKNTGLNQVRVSS